MAEPVNKLSSEKESEIGPPYLVDDFPHLLSRSLEPLWSEWLQEKPRPGYWAEANPIPREIALAYRSLATWPNSWESLSTELKREELASVLQKKFGGEYLRIRFGAPELDAPEGTWKHLGIHVEEWHRLYGSRPKAPQGQVLEELPFEAANPQSHLVYWLAEIDRRDTSFLAILETTGRQNLGRRGNIEVIAYGTQVQVHLPVAAVRIGHDHPHLPIVVARARYDRKFYKVSSTWRNGDF